MIESIHPNNGNDAATKLLLGAAIIITSAITIDKTNRTLNPVSLKRTSIFVELVKTVFNEFILTLFSELHYLSHNIFNFGKYIVLLTT